MATSYTLRLIGVVKAAYQASANAIAKQADIDPDGGESAWSVPLRLAGDATGVVQAYWCGWSLTPAQAIALRTRLKAAGLSDAEVRFVPASEKATFVAAPTAKAYFFDGRDGAWTAADVLAATGLATSPGPT